MGKKLLLQPKVISFALSLCAHFRGVEQFCCAAYFAHRKIKKQEFVQAILDEQSKQRLANIYDPDAIAKVGRMYSRPAQELALKLGLHDAKFVDQLGWMERAKKHWERVRPSQFRTQSSTCYKAKPKCTPLSRNSWHDRSTIKISVE
jgi:AraC-like DNA-binding protein